MDRNRRLDAAKGLLITSVVFGHFLEIAAAPSSHDLPPGWFQFPQSFLLTCLYMFTIPLFVMFAGTTARVSTRYLRAVQLLVIFVPLQLALVVPLLLTGRLDATWLVIPIYALWFLVALATYLIATPLIERWPRAALVGSVALALAAALSAANPGLFAYARIAFFLPFFVVGFIWGGAILQSVPANALSAALGVVAVVGAALVAARISSDPLWVMGNGTARASGATLDQGLAIRSMILLLMAFASWRAIAFLPPRSSVLEQLGRRSLSIYVLHQLVVLPLSAVTPPRSVSPIICTLIAVVAAAATIWVTSLAAFDRWIRHISASVAERLVHRVLPHREAVARRPRGSRSEVRPTEEAERRSPPPSTSGDPR